MSNIRVRFMRGEEVKYISHLDLMKAFERAIRRSNIPISYSQGFNPHPQMVFGLPLSVGVTSQAEYADFEVEGDLPPEEFMQRLNMQLPAGLRITAAKTRQGKANIMASISSASYDILLAVQPGIDEGLIRSKMEQLIQEPEIIVKKEGKKGKKDIDIKPMIIGVELKNLGNVSPDQQVKGCSGDDQEDSRKWLNGYIKGLYSANMLKPSFNAEDIICLSALLSAGSVANLKPELLVEALAGFAGWTIKLVKVHRTGLFISKEGRGLCPLDSNAL